MPSGFHVRFFFRAGNKRQTLKSLVVFFMDLPPFFNKFIYFFLLRSKKNLLFVTTIPPSPLVMVFTGWNENTVKSARDPTLLPLYKLPKECAASSIVTSLFFFAICNISSQLAW